MNNNVEAVNAQDDSNILSEEHSDLIHAIQIGEIAIKQGRTRPADEVFNEFLSKIGWLGDEKSAP